ncbi:hypothetical protein [Streptomyces sp. XC 2026]|uniref:hypothetical protein n=1 Tax=Streptomyces sp. XC 2026 TaxID=2782004 RepID=UPI0019053D2A|nr:hypothetical protein [Streptomyces sp. XC 2026]QQN79740.1 hypothetical protein IPZ77_21680 [Streptomyces sp. XC 2026]QQN80652.1 hypothetical protein IPZ77_26975 [Streptomyces sp. XC 2026]
MPKLTDLRNKVLGHPEDVAASREARRQLHTEAAGITDETDPTYLELNAAANEAHRQLPPLGRWLRG